MVDRQPLETIVLTLLQTIRNRPPGVLQEEFTGPPEFFPGGFRLEWWISEEGALLEAALTLAETYPTLRDRYTVEEIRRRILDTVRANLSRFNWEPFVSVARVPRTLRECAKPDAIEFLVSALIAWAVNSDPAIFLMPVAGLRPACDVTLSNLLWVSREAPPDRLTSLISLSVLPETLAVFPPWVAGPSNGQRPLGPGDSLLGVVATGLQAGISALRRAAGAICVAMPDGEVSLRSVPAWSNVFELSEHGPQVLTAPGPILPRVGDAKALDESRLDVFKSQLMPRATQKCDRQRRVALEFLSTGWVLSGTPEFISYFVALDALFGGSRGMWRSKEIVQRAASRLRTQAAQDRIELIVKIRQEILHGGCVNVEASRWYLPYHRRFGRHPTDDLLHVVRQCLQHEA